MKRTWVKVGAALILGVLIGRETTSKPPPRVPIDYTTPITAFKLNYNEKGGYDRYTFNPLKVERDGSETKIAERPADPDSVWLVSLNGGRVKVFAELVKD